MAAETEKFLAEYKRLENVLRDGVFKILGGFCKKKGGR